MNVKIRLIILNFLQFFVWGSWLITIGVFWFHTKGWSGSDFGKIFATLGISSIFMPTIAGIITDRWINSEKFLGVLHLLYGITFCMLPSVNDPQSVYCLIFLGMIFYMPTISLTNSVSYSVLKSNNFDVVKDFPPIRVFGTIGFIVAMWVVNLTGNKASANQFYIAGIFAILLGIYSFTLPSCPPAKQNNNNNSWIDTLGLGAFKLFGQYKMALFFIFSMLIGAALQLTNMYGDTFLSDFEKNPQYANSFVVKYSTIIMSISQISETLFILTIPFFLRRLGIKKVMLMSMFAWVLRFGLFAYGTPNGIGFGFIILSCIVYGMAFDFFNISGSLFVENETTPEIRSSAQGLFMMMTNGFGAIMGSWLSGYLIEKFFKTAEGNFQWHEIWLSFSAYSLVIAFLFMVLFKYEHKEEKNA